MKEKKTILKTVNDDIFGDISIIESTKLISFSKNQISSNGKFTEFYDWTSLVKVEQKKIEILAKSRLFFKMKDVVENPLDTAYLQRRIKSSGIKDKDLINVSLWNSYEKKDVLFLMSKTFSNIINEFNEKYKNIIKGIDMSIKPFFLIRDSECAYNYDKKAVFAYRSLSWLSKKENQNPLYYIDGDNFIDGVYIHMIPELIRNDEELDGNLLKEW